MAAIAHVGLLEELRAAAPCPAADADHAEHDLIARLLARAESRVESRDRESSGGCLEEMRGG